MSSAYSELGGRRDGRRSRLDQRRTALLGALLVILMSTIGLAVPIPSLGGSTLAVAAIQRAKSFIELMHQRSPGRRVVGHLALTKHKRVAARERALPKIRKRRVETAALPPFPAELPPALVDLVAPPIGIEMANLEAVPVGPFSAMPPGLPGFYLPPSGGGFILPPTESPSPPVTPPIGGAVPEPGAWAMMLLGFGLISWSLRLRSCREQSTTPR